MNKIKRIYSSLLLMLVCFASNLSQPVKSILLNAQITKIEKPDKSFRLYGGKNLLKNNESSDNVKLADHYSHSSHESHSSHFSSR